MFFIDPSYVKDEVWAFLLNSLNIKRGFSLLPKEQLPDCLTRLMGRELLTFKATDFRLEKFFGHDMGDECTFWLKAELLQRIYISREDIANNSDKPQRKSTDDIRSSIMESLSSSNLVVFLCLNEFSQGYSGAYYAPHDVSRYVGALPEDCLNEIFGIPYLDWGGCIEEYIESIDKVSARFDCSDYEKVDGWMRTNFKCSVAEWMKSHFECDEEECDEEECDEEECDNEDGENENGENENGENEEVFSEYFNATNIITYCLNILHKQNKHYLYGDKCNFILIDSFLTRSYRYCYRKDCRGCESECWKRCYVSVCFQGWFFSDEQKSKILKGLRRQYERKKELEEYTSEFTEAEVSDEQLMSGKHNVELCWFVKHNYSLSSLYDANCCHNWDSPLYLINENGKRVFQEITRKAWLYEFESEMELKFEERAENAWYSAEELQQMEREFWEECGEAASNCDSWPGWG